MNRFRSLPRGAPDWVLFNRELETENRKWPAQLQPVPEDKWPPVAQFDAKGRVVARVVGAWRSRKFMVQAILEGGLTRLVINRTEVDMDRKWRDGITWDDIQRLKAEAGFADRWAAEVYPPDAELVNETNTRHVWLLPRRPAFALKRKPGAA